ncbi:MAG TPA: hypothetical protein VME69_01220, partial [Methylocella sp.]|nr:hypothetical protein [Methylocella sp.]
MTEGNPLEAFKKLKKEAGGVSDSGRVGAVVGVAVILGAVAYFTGLFGGHPKPADQPVSANKEEAAATIELNEKQVASIKVEPVGEHLFKLEKGAVGSTDYNEDMAVQVFTNYQG